MATVDWYTVKLSLSEVDLYLRYQRTFGRQCVYFDSMNLYCMVVCQTGVLYDVLWLTVCQTGVQNGGDG